MTKTNKIWTINITSFANINGLSSEQIEQALYAYKNESYSQWRDEKAEQRLLKYGDNEIASWQLNKSAERYKKWFENLQFTIDNKVLSLDVRFDISFPEDWTVPFVVEFVSGFCNECLIIFIQNRIENFAKSLQHDFNYRTQVKFLKELCKNESTIAFDSSKTPQDIHFQGLTFTLNSIVDDQYSYKLGYVLTYCEPSSPHYQMYSEYGGWLNPFQENKPQTFLWLEENISSSDEFQRALDLCAFFLTENKLI